MADNTDSKEQQAKITLHWLNGSRSQRVLWLLEACSAKIPYEVKVYTRQDNKLAPPSLKEVHPLGKSPVITFTSPAATSPVVLAESGAIFGFVTDYYGSHLVPKRFRDGFENQPGGETEEWLRYRFFMHFAEGSFMSMLFVSFVMEQIRNAPVPFFLKPITRGVANNVDSAFLSQQLATQFAFLESQLATSPTNGSYLCGAELTAADILMSYPIIAGKSRFREGGKYPKLVAYAERLEKEAGYLRSIEKAEEITGEKYQLLP